MELNRYLLIGSTVAGLVHGFSDAQGIPLSDRLEFALTYGPAIVRGTIQGIKWGAIGAGRVTIVGSTTVYSHSRKDLDTILGIALGAAGAGVISGIVGAGIGATKGGVQTVMGYGIGYLAGYLTR